MANRVITANPYGAVNMADLDAFERSLGCALPRPYRNYLIQFNGGKFQNDIVHISDSDADTRVHHMYGLHRGPAYTQLAIGRPPDIGRSYLAVCDDAFGNHFLIRLEGDGVGGIYFYDHERADCASSAIAVADDFEKFVNSMSSEEQNMSDFRRRDPEGYRDFQERLREMKRLREEELKKGQ